MANNKVIFGNTTIMDITDTTAVASDVTAGKDIYLADGTKVTGTNTFDVDSSGVTATQENVLRGKTFAKDGAVLTGAMPNYGAFNAYIDSKYSRITIPEGYHNGHGVAMIGSTYYYDIIPENIRSGVDILGVTGTYAGLDVSDTTATASDVAKGKYFYNASGVKTTGTAEILYPSVIWKDPITLTFTNSNATNELQYVEAENYPFFKLVGRIRRKTAGSSTGNSYTYFYANNEDLPSIDAEYAVRNRYQIVNTNDFTVEVTTLLDTKTEGHEGELRLRLNNVNSNYSQYYGGDYIWWIDKNRCDPNSFFYNMPFVRSNVRLE